MSEREIPDEQTRATLRRTLRQQLEQMQPPLRTLAENVLAEGSRIDLVARDPIGGLVVVLIGDVGEDLELFTRSLAHRSWVEQRIPDWLQLAPELALSSRVHALILCPEFRPETIAAARSNASLVRLSLYRNLQPAAGTLLLEPLNPPLAEDETEARPMPPLGAAARLVSTPAEVPRDPAPLEPAARPSEFRSGLSEADLQISPEERRDFA